MTNDGRAENAAANRFLLQLIADRQAGRERTLEEYQALFPGLEEWIASEHGRVLAGAGKTEFPSGDPLAPLTVGARVGPYRLVDELGRGGQGSVWRAEDTRIGRTVALKLISWASWVPDAVARFRREANLASRLEHPGICTVFEADGEGGVPYVAMQLVEGETLRERLRREAGGARRTSMEVLAGLVEEAARALHAAHEAGIVHRDVKPANLMVTPEGRAVVLDFGIAREVDVEGSTLTLTGELHGTPTYMAPEQLAGQRPDRRSDVWSLGVTLYEALALRAPFTGPTFQALCRAVLETEPDPPTYAGKRLPRDLEVVLATALCKEPEGRYATALDLARDLEAWRGGRTIRARRVGALGRAARWARREPARAALVGAMCSALLVAAGLGGFLFARRGELRAGASALRETERLALIRDVSSGLLRGPGVEDRARAALEEDPGLTRLRASLLWHYANEGRLDEARALYAAAPAGPDGQEDPRALDLAYAMALAQAGHDDEAAPLFEALGEPRTMLESFYAAMRTRTGGADPDGGRAFELLNRSVLLNPELGEEYLLRYVELAVGAGDFEAAQRAADALELNHPDSGLAAFHVAMAWARDDMERSRRAMERSVELEIGIPMVYVVVGDYAEVDGDPERATELFEQGLAAAPEGSDDWVDVLSLRVFQHLRRGRNAAALATAERALAVLPEHIECLVMRAKALRALGRTDDYDATVARARELSPDHPRLVELEAE